MRQINFAACVLIREMPQTARRGLAVGVFLAAAWLAAETVPSSLRRPRLLGSLAAGVVAACLAASAAQARYWRDILNDNEMSISRNVEALPAYLNRMLTGDLYQKIKKETKSRLESIPRVGGKAAKIAQKTEEMIKRLFLPGIIFEELGFTYVGP